MKKGLLILISLSLFCFHAVADITNIPNLLSAPVVLYDEANNVLADGDYDIIIRLKNGVTGRVIYGEEQTVSVYNGVAKITIGQGYALGSGKSSPAGGLYYEDFTTDANIRVEMLVSGQSSPQVITTLGSQPYAFIAQHAISVANDSITSDKIADGTIKSEDLDEKFLETLTSSVSSEIAEEFTGEIDAQNVIVDPSLGLNNASGTNLESVLSQIDSALDNLREVHISQVVGGLQNSIDNLTFNDVSGTLSDNQIPPSITRDSELIFNNIGGTINNNQIPSSITRDSELSDYLNRSGGTMTGTINMSENNITRIGVAEYNLEDELDEINTFMENDENVDSGQVSSAHGRAQLVNGGQDATCSGGYNIDSQTTDVSASIMDGVQCNFDTNLSTSNYQVILSPEFSCSGFQAPGCSVSNKTTSGFTLDCRCPSVQTLPSATARVNFVVYAN